MQTGTDQAVTRREHVLDLEAKRVISTDPFGGLTTEGNLTRLLDDSTTDVIYFGIAQVGSNTVSGRSQAIWQIYKVDMTVSPKGIALWADGTDAFTNVWDDRALYSYS